MSSDKNNLSDSDTEYEPFSDEESSENSKNINLIENSILIKEKKEEEVNPDESKNITISKQLSRNKLLRILSRR